jgi:polyvinyl alcohol dehydrogenase (cytochrome)
MRLMTMPSQVVAALAVAWVCFQGLTDASSGAGGQAASQPNGEAIYKAQCATCHETGENRAPLRETILLKTRAAVLASLVSGSMSINAKDLSAAEKRAVADYMAGPDNPAETADMPPTAICGTGKGTSSDPLASPRWIGWGVDLSNTRFQPAKEAGLSASDVPNLKLKWAFGFPGGSTQAYSQPTVAGGRVYVGSDKGAVYALDAATGCAHWSYAAAGAVRSGIVIGRVPGSGTPQYAAFFGDLTATVYAVDLATGAALWSTQVDTHAAARITGTPTLDGNRLYVPVSSWEEGAGARPNYQCCTFRGSVVALDAATGKMVWQAFVIPDKPQPVRKNAVGTQLWGPAGGAIWSAPTIDVKRRAVYVGTGNAYTAPAAATTDAIMAFDLDTGKVKWVRQLTPNDNFVIGCGPNNPNCPEAGPDYDFGNSPILRTLDNGKSVLLAGQKSGTAWALDPDREGAIVWQFKAGKGSALGGIEWGMAADEQQVYVPVSDVLSPPNEAGGLFAVKIATGEKVWHTPAPKLNCTGGRGCTGAQSAAISAIPGIVFSGSVDGHLRAYSTKDGAIVWDVDTAREYETVNGVKATGGSLDAAGPAIAGGMVFTNSGYGQWRGKPGNVLLAFGVEK